MAHPIICSFDIHWTFGSFEQKQLSNLSELNKFDCFVLLKHPKVFNYKLFLPLFDHTFSGLLLVSMSFLNVCVVLLPDLPSRGIVRACFVLLSKTVIIDLKLLLNFVIIVL